MKRARGFTLLELAVIMAVIAVLAGVAAPRFLDMGAARGHAAARRLSADIRYAQRLAVSTHTRCGVAVGLVPATSYSVYTVGAGGTRTSVLDPLTRQPLDVTLAVTLGPANAFVEFDERGRPIDPVGGPFTLPGRTVTVEAETGTALR